MWVPLVQLEISKIVHGIICMKSKLFMGDCGFMSDPLTLWDIGKNYFREAYSQTTWNCWILTTEDSQRRSSSGRVRLRTSKCCERWVML